MMDIIFKLQILWWNILQAFDSWKREVWENDLDKPYCCSGGGVFGDVCGCEGITLREILNQPHMRERS